MKDVVVSERKLGFCGGTSSAGGPSHCFLIESRMPRCRVKVKKQEVSERNFGFRAGGCLRPEGFFFCFHRQPAAPENGKLCDGFIPIDPASKVFCRNIRRGLLLRFLCGVFSARSCLRVRFFRGLIDVGVAMLMSRAILGAVQGMKVRRLCRRFVGGQGLAPRAMGRQERGREGERREGERERGREGERERGREGGREGERERGREGERGERERGREGERERGREGREGERERGRGGEGEGERGRGEGERERGREGERERGREGERERGREERGREGERERGREGERERGREGERERGREGERERGREGERERGREGARAVPIIMAHYITLGPLNPVVFVVDPKPETLFKWVRVWGLGLACLVGPKTRNPKPLAGSEGASS